MDGGTPENELGKSIDVRREGIVVENDGCVSIQARDAHDGVDQCINDIVDEVYHEDTSI